MGAPKLLMKELLKKCKPWNTSGSLSQRNKTGNYYRYTCLRLDLFMGKHLFHRAGMGKKWGDWAVLGGLLFPTYAYRTPTHCRTSVLREGPGVTQPVLRNKSNRQGGGGFHARPLLSSPTPGSCHACLALESSSAKTPLSFLVSPAGWTPNLSAS